MHGRVKKDVVQLPPEELEKQREHVRTAKGLFKKLLDLRQARTYSEQTFEMTTKALFFHPEFPTMWAYRREIFESGEVGGDLKALYEAEMKLLEKALRRSTKIYSIWFHRKWVVDKLFELCGTNTAAAREVLETELGLCRKLHEADERNFHCWNHRAYVMGLMQRSLQARKMNFAPQPRDAGVAQVAEQQSTAEATAEAAEKVADPGPDPDPYDIDLKLSKELIDRNFSNYSAWHLRTLLQEDADSNKVDIDEELEWVQQGIYTEPNDQSVWLYHHWLTTLGRGCEELRITHSAVHEGEIFVFFNKPVCVVEREGTSVKIVTEEVDMLKGTMTPLGPDPASTVSSTLRRTRRLPKLRKRWSQGYRVTVRSGGGFSPFSSINGDVHIEVQVEECGTNEDGTAANRTRTVEWNGRPVQSDNLQGSHGDHAPIVDAFLDGTPDLDHLEVVRTELKRIEELLEIEPDCRYALLAQGRLALHGGAAHGVTALLTMLQAVCAGYKRAAELDPTRRGYYAEALAAAQLRLRVLVAVRSTGPEDVPLGVPGLRHLQPTTILPLMGVRVLNISGGEIRDLGPILLLASLEELNASKNNLRGDFRQAFCLPLLRLLDLSQNNLDALPSGDGETAPLPPTHLEEIDVSGNPALVKLQEEDKLEGRLGLSSNWMVDFDSPDGIIMRNAES